MLNKNTYIKLNNIILLFILTSILSSQDLNELAKEAKKLGISNNQINKIKDKYIDDRSSLENALESESDNSSDLKTRDEVIKDIEKIKDENISIDVSKASVEDANHNELESDKNKLSVRNVSSKSKLEYFGYDIFKNNPGLYKNTINEYINPSYVIGPGDEIIIMLWGATEQIKTYVVARDGYIFIDNIGQVFVNGLNLEKLEKKLEKILAKAYSTLGNSLNQQSTYFDVSLGSFSMRKSRIHVVGNVDNPGAYEMGPSATLFTSLFYFNGPSINGTLRDVKLIRNGKTLSSIDFYDYLISGKKRGDKKLESDDVIFISNRAKTVTTKGEIAVNAIFELKNDETLSDLIGYAGGLKNTTYHKRIQINRIVPIYDRENIKSDRVVLDVDYDDLIRKNKSYNLVDGDTILFYKITDQKDNFVSINGPVARPGIYGLSENMSIADLIKKADGLTGDAYMERIDILRTNSDNSKTQLDFSLSATLEDSTNKGYFLKSGDIITLHSNSDLEYVENFKISGHVFFPGEKKYRDETELYDLVFLGGGFENDDHLDNAYMERSILIRKNKFGLKPTIIPFRLDSLLEGKGMASEILQMGDEVIIYSKLDIFGLISKTYTVEGYIKKNGVFPLYEGTRVLDAIFLSGTYKDSSFYKNLFKERADLIRLSPKGDLREIIKINIGDLIDSLDLSQNYYLKDRDILRLYDNRIFSVEPTVEILGEVNEPDVYLLKNQMTLADLILESGGISSSIIRFNVEVARMKDAFFDQSRNQLNNIEIITMNLINDESLFSKKPSQDNIDGNFKLRIYDKITIRKEQNYNDVEKVFISGYVRYPGTYILTRNNDMVSDIINRAGGLQEEAYPAASKFKRNNNSINISFEKILNNPKSKYNFILMGGDSIEIKSFTNIVSITGAINRSGNYQYIKGKKFRDYVKMAGGYKENASTYSSYIEYPDGTSKKISFLRKNPKIMDGSKIFIFSKVDQKKFSFTEYVTNLTSIYADLMQAYVLLIALGRT